jgi:hypothetical protein
MMTNSLKMVEDSAVSLITNIIDNFVTIVISILVCLQIDMTHFCYDVFYKTILNITSKQFQQTNNLTIHVILPLIVNVLFNLFVFYYVMYGLYKYLHSLQNHLSTTFKFLPSENLRNRLSNNQQVKHSVCLFQQVASQLIFLLLLWNVLLVTFYYKNMSFCFKQNIYYDNLSGSDITLSLEKYQTDHCLETNYIVFRHLDVVFYYKYSFWVLNVIILVSNVIKDRYMDLVISSIVIPTFAIPQPKVEEKGSLFNTCPPPPQIRDCPLSPQMTKIRLRFVIFN